MERQKKNSILLAAVEAFARFGFKKASVEEIARLAGVAKGTVYLACQSKEDLFYQAVHSEIRAWVAETARLIDPRVPADELLTIVSRDGVDYLNRHALVRDLFYGRYQELFTGWDNRFEELRLLGRANVIEIVKLGIKQGRFREGLDVEQVATLLQDLQLCTFLFYNQPDGREERLARRAVAGFDLVLNGIRTPVAKAQHPVGPATAPPLAEAAAAHPSRRSSTSAEAGRGRKPGGKPRRR